MIEQKLNNRFSAEEMAERLERFKADVYFPDIKPDDNIVNLINSLSKRDFIKNMTPIDGSEYLIQISQYALFLNIQENRCVSYVNWCESNIKQIVGKKLQEAKGFTFQEKDLEIRANDENASYLEQQKLVTQSKLDMVKFLSQKIHFIIDSIKVHINELHRYRKDIQ